VRSSAGTYAFVFPVIIAAWVLGVVALVTDVKWTLAVAGALLVLAGLRGLTSPEAWLGLARSSLAGGWYSESYRERVGTSQGLRIATCGSMLLIGTVWFAIGTLG
jgi:hypothetical protein